MNIYFIFLCIFANIMTIMSFPKHDYHSKGRSWEYGSKIIHPSKPHKEDHGYEYHKFDHGPKDDGKGWTHSSDSGNSHHEKHDLHDYKHDSHDDKFELPVHVPVHVPDVPVHFPKYETDLGHIPEYHHKPEFEHKPEPKYEFRHHYEPKHIEEHKPIEKHDKFSDIGIKVNVDDIIDDISKDLKKTTKF